MSDKKEIAVFMELKGELTPKILRTLENTLNIPPGIVESYENDPIKFLKAIKYWDGMNPAIFDEALRGISGYMVNTARKLKWLSNPQYEQQLPREHSVENFFQLLKNELTTSELLLLTDVPPETQSTHSMLKSCFEKGKIGKDLNSFCDYLKLLKRNNLETKVRKFEPTFQNLTIEDFNDQIHKEMELGESEGNLDLESRLRKYLETQNKKVSVVLNEATVPIESVYTPLITIKVKPAKERLMEESGINEIDFLRNIHEQVKHESVETVEFEKIIRECSSTDPKILCLIGNPGSGKSFLCQHFAFLYGTNKLRNYRFAISIPCRNEEWHKLEETRHEKERQVDPPFIMNWLSLSMSIGAKWSETLSRHLMRSDGEGLLVILDGVDEFTRSIPFHSTLLCKILERRLLIHSTILVTSRPAAWSELLLSQDKKFEINDNFQVLGFSPESRDLYFKKRIEGVEKLNNVHELFEIHEEIKQLALVPVNASLFSALFNQSESILSNTLSHLYMQLIVYIIRRQLSRMGLKEQSQLQSIDSFHSAIRECINTICTEANQGIFERELTSDKHIPITIDDKTYDSERLGLMQAHMKVVSFGRRVKVWTFQHLTIQEFLAARSICDNAWPYRLMIIRYFTAFPRYLVSYKMVIRFVCGILRHDAGGVTPILCRHAFPVPMPLSETPMAYQLRYLLELVDVSEWVEFTQSLLFLCTLIVETKSDSDSISEHFAYFKRQFSGPLYLYFRFSISPNEWHSFLKSLKYIFEFQVLQIQSDFVSSVQFNSFLNQSMYCSINYLALMFNEKSFNEILPYTSILYSDTMPHDTKISIHFHSCDLSGCDSSQLLFSSTNRFVGSLMVYESAMNESMSLELTNQFASLENIFYKPVSASSDWPILLRSINTNPINGLYIRDYDGYIEDTPSDILSGLSSLKELDWDTKEDCYKCLPFLHNNSSLTQLSLFSLTPPSNDESLLLPLTELINSNSKSLRDINLSYLHLAGFNSWDSFLNPITLCSNLMMLSLDRTDFHSDCISSLRGTISALISLVSLFLYYVPLQDKGLLVLCQSLLCHKAIRKLGILNCDLSSESCFPLIRLMHTLPRLKMLKLNEYELSTPDPEPLQLLLQTAEKCSVKIGYFE